MAVITLTPEQVASVLAQVGGSVEIPPVVVPPYVPPVVVPPVVVPPYVPPVVVPPANIPGDAIKLDDLYFDGSRKYTGNMGWGVTGQHPVYARIILPEPFPMGLTATISVFEYIDPQYARKLYLSKTPCDFTPEWPALGIGSSASIQVQFGGSATNKVVLNPGEVWYMNLEHKRSSGAYSAGKDATANFAINLSVPN